MARGGGRAPAITGPSRPEEGAATSGRRSRSPPVRGPQGGGGGRSYTVEALASNSATVPREEEGRRRHALPGEEVGPGRESAATSGRRSRSPLVRRPEGGGEGPRTSVKLALRIPRRCPREEEGRRRYCHCPGRRSGAGEFGAATSGRRSRSPLVRRPEGGGEGPRTPVKLALRIPRRCPGRRRGAAAIAFVRGGGRTPAN